MNKIKFILLLTVFLVRPSFSLEGYNELYQEVLEHSSAKAFYYENSNYPAPSFNELMITNKAFKTVKAVIENSSQMGFSNGIDLMKEVYLIEENLLNLNKNKEFSNECFYLISLDKTKNLGADINKVALIVKAHKENFNQKMAFTGFNQEVAFYGEENPCLDLKSSGFEPIAQDELELKSFYNNTKFIPEESIKGFYNAISLGGPNGGGGGGPVIVKYIKDIP